MPEVLVHKATYTASDRSHYYGNMPFPLVPPLCMPHIERNCYIAAGRAAQGAARTGLIVHLKPERLTAVLDVSCVVLTKQ